MQQQLVMALLKYRNGVTSLPLEFLNNFSNVTKVEIPSSVTSISTGFFSKYVTDVTIASGNNNFIVDDSNGMILSKDNQTLVSYFKNEQSVTVPDNVKKLGNRCFYGDRSSNVKSITLPTGLTTIDYEAISCKQVTNMSIGASVTKIDENCFQGCSSLTKIKIHKAIDSIPGSPWSAAIGARAVEWEE